MSMLGLVERITAAPRLQMTLMWQKNAFYIPVHVVALHSWVWLVFATETELLQREILGKCSVLI